MMKSCAGGTGVLGGVFTSCHFLESSHQEQYWCEWSCALKFDLSWTKYDQMLESALGEPVSWAEFLQDVSFWIQATRNNIVVNEVVDWRITSDEPNITKCWKVRWGNRCPGRRFYKMSIFKFKPSRIILMWMKLGIENPSGMNQIWPNGEKCAGGTGVLSGVFPTCHFLNSGHIDVNEVVHWNFTCDEPNMTKHLKCAGGTGVPSGVFLKMSFFKLRPQGITWIKPRLSGIILMWVKLWLDKWPWMNQIWPNTEKCAGGTSVLSGVFSRCHFLNSGYQE